MKGDSRLQSHLKNHCVDLDGADWHVSEPAQSRLGYFSQAIAVSCNFLQSRKPDVGQQALRGWCEHVGKVDANISSATTRKVGKGRGNYN